MNSEEEIRHDEDRPPKPFRLDHQKVREFAVEHDLDDVVRSIDMLAEDRKKEAERNMKEGD